MFPLWYTMQVASPSTDLIQSSAADLKRQKFHDALIEALDRGMKPPDIAKALAKGDKAKAKRLRQRIWKTIRSDAEFHRRLGERAKGQMVVDMLPAVNAVGKRAARGRMDAAKLLLEATGVHNPRIKHEHTGEIKVSLDLPRPDFVEATVVEDITDAVAAEIDEDGRPDAS